MAAAMTHPMVTAARKSANIKAPAATMPLLTRCTPKAINAAAVP
jgi:hypothetical protein